MKFATLIIAKPFGVLKLSSKGTPAQVHLNELLQSAAADMKIRPESGRKFERFACR